MIFMSGGSLVPSNAKKSMLFFGFLNNVDLILALSGIGVTFILFLIFGTDEFSTSILCVLPALICLFLVIPMPKYHNIMCLIGDVFKFYYSRRTYKWKGWCLYDEFKE